MTAAWLCLALALDPRVIERFYNSTPTLEADFVQTYKSGGRTRHQSGRLVLRKPGRMRWEYADGNVFVTDGKMVWFYQAVANRAEHSAVKESGDLRAPLAFLLGRLDFSKLFSAVREDQGMLTATPRSDRAPYREVQFRALPDGSLDLVRVTGQDASIMEFEFTNQRRGVTVDDRVFAFTPPPGAQVVAAGDEPN